MNLTGIFLDPSLFSPNLGKRRFFAGGTSLSFLSGDVSTGTFVNEDGKPGSSFDVLDDLSESAPCSSSELVDENDS